LSETVRKDLHEVSHGSFQCVGSRSEVLMHDMIALGQHETGHYTVYDT